MDNSFDRFRDGYQAFRERYIKQDPSMMKELSKKQTPETLIIACSDSRVDPAVILQCDPGELFVVRNVANIVPPYEEGGVHGTSAALEYAVRFLKVKHIVIMGHSQCGGVQALHENLQGTDFILPWVSLIEKTPVGTDYDQAAQLAVHQSYKNCLSFPWVTERVQKNELAIHQWFFNIKQGQLYQYEQKTDRYEEFLKKSA